MSQATHHETAPEDRIPFAQKLFYGCGAFVNNLLAAAIGGMVIVLNLGLGMNPALVGLLGALPRAHRCDHRPAHGLHLRQHANALGPTSALYIAGAIAAGVIYAILWQLPADKTESFYFWYFLSGSFVFYLAYTMFATPWVALGYELTPDYHERTRLMGVQNFVGQLAYLVAPWFLWFMQLETWFDDMIDGAGRPRDHHRSRFDCRRNHAGHLPARTFQRYRRDRVQGRGVEPDGVGTVILRNLKSFALGFVTTMKFKPFLKLCGATFLVFNGFMLIASFQFYVIIYYVFGGDTVEGAEWAGYSGTIGAVSTFCVIVFVTWLGTKIGKRKAFYVSTGVSMAGYALKWFCYNPEIPWLLLLPAPLMAFGLGGLFTLMPAMIADVVDADELQTHERREGMYGSIFWWVVKLGMAAALAGGGYLLNATGFDVALEGNQAEQTIFLMRLFDAFVPAIASGIAIWIIATFSITEETAYKVRQQLEQRRGPAPNPVPPELPAGTPVTARRGRRKHSSLSVLHTPRPRSP